MAVKQLKTKAEFDNCLKDNADKLVVVDFFATWCGPCKIIGPKIEKMAIEMKDVIFVKVNVEENEETSEAEKISAMPTFKLYKGGQEVAELVGADENQLRTLIAKNR